MIKIGITGGIGCGKTTISKKFIQKGIPVLNTDLLAREIMETDQDIIYSVKQNFGNSTYIDNKLNRKYLANIVFNDSKKLNILDNITRPVIRKEILNWIDIQKTEICMVESALMFNTDLYTIFDELICITVDEETRLERIIKRDNCTKEEALARINKQLSQNEMITRCRFLILNDSTTDIDNQINYIINSLNNDYFLSNNI